MSNDFPRPPLRFVTIYCYSYNDGSAINITASLDTVAGEACYKLSVSKRKEIGIAILPALFVT